MRPLILSGGPAVGKSTCGRLLAGERQRAAFVDADDIRQLVLAGPATLWSGPEGERQFLLAARNTAALARNFRAEGFEVVIADYVTAASLEIYRAEIPACFCVHLQLPLDGARKRAAARVVHLTDDEFDHLHHLVERPPPADVVLEVSGLDAKEQTSRIRRAWHRASAVRS